MKKTLIIFTLILMAMVTAATAGADVNEELTFTNFTDEDLYVELAVLDHGSWVYYDIYVLADESSIANFWTYNLFATYSACAYGEFTDDFYGCIESEVDSGSPHIYFDNTGIPYLSGAPNLAAADVFMFDSVGTSADVVVVPGDSHGHGHGGGCFIGGLD